MRDEDDGHLSRSLLTENGRKPADGGSIKPRRGLIEEEQPRLVNEGSRQSYALSLPA
jgi:hypothetical protein